PPRRMGASTHAELLTILRASPNDPLVSAPRTYAERIEALSTEPHDPMHRGATPDPQRIVVRCVEAGSHGDSTSQGGASRTNLLFALHQAATWRGSRCTVEPTNRECGAHQWGVPISLIRFLLMLKWEIVNATVPAARWTIRGMTSGRSSLPGSKSAVCGSVWCGSHGGAHGTSLVQRISCRRPSCASSTRTIFPGTASSPSGGS